MKSLDKKDTYVNATLKLRARVVERGKELAKKMKELDIDGWDNGLYVDGTSITLHYIKSNVGTDEILTLGDDPGDLLSTRASTSEEFYYLHGDFHKPIRYAHPKTFVRFANLWGAITEAIAEIERDKADEATTAFNNLEV